MYPCANYLGKCATKWFCNMRAINININGRLFYTLVRFESVLQTKWFHDMKAIGQSLSASTLECYGRLVSIASIPFRDCPIAFMLRNNLV